MPKTTEEIVAHAAQLTLRKGENEPRLVALTQSVRRRAAAEQAVADAVASARRFGYSWASIGATLGTSGEAARQRYGVNKWSK